MKRLCFLLCALFFALPSISEVKPEPPERGTVFIGGGTFFNKRLGTGFCLDTPCLHVLTNYHVLQTIGKDRMRVEGVRVADARSTTNERDPKAHLVPGADGKLKFHFDPAHDMALLTLEKPLGKFHGLTFAHYAPKIGQIVSKTARYGKSIDTSRGGILATDAVIMYPGDRLGESVRTLVLSFPSRAGNSGGVIADERGFVVGIVYGIGPTSLNPNAVNTFALPVSVISLFLRETDPEFWAEIFLGRKGTPEEIAAEIQRLEGGDILQEKPGTPPSRPMLTTLMQLDAQPVIPNGANTDDLVGALREQVKTNAGRMTSVFARETIETWGNNVARETSKHEVAIYDGNQIFREIKSDGREGSPMRYLPLPKTGISPGNQWQDLLRKIQNPRMKIVYAGTAKSSNEPVHVYRYHASASDGVCTWRERLRGWEGFIDCSGWIITDNNFNTLEISEELDPPAGGIALIAQIHVLYKFFPLETGTPLLLPATISMSAQFRDLDWYFASGTWNDYHHFRANTKLIFDIPETKN